jgi:hypothetical protein
MQQINHAIQLGKAMQTGREMMKGQRLPLLARCALPGKQRCNGGRIDRRYIREIERRFARPYGMQTGITDGFRVMDGKSEAGTKHKWGVWQIRKFLQFCSRLRPDACSSRPAT